MLSKIWSGSVRIAENSQHLVVVVFSPFTGVTVQIVRNSHFSKYEYIFAVAFYRYLVSSKWRMLKNFLSNNFFWKFRY